MDYFVPKSKFHILFSLTVILAGQKKDRNQKSKQRGREVGGEPRDHSGMEIKAWRNLRRFFFFFLMKTERTWGLTRGDFYFYILEVSVLIRMENGNFSDDLAENQEEKN